MKQILAGITLLLLTGCRVGPDYCAPATAASEQWDAAIEEQLYDAAPPVSLAMLIDDPLLAGYLTHLRCANPDAKIAAAKVCEAFALRDISSAKLLPFIDNRIAYNRARPAGGILSGGMGDGGALAGIPLNLTQQFFLADFDALWEIDLFGRNHREVESASAYLEMQAASYDSILVSLNAEFARNYLELRRNQAQLELIQKEIEIRQALYNEEQRRLNFGIAAKRTLLESRADLEDLRADAPHYQSEVLSRMYKLSILIGQTPATLVPELEQNQALPEIRDPVPIGFPSDLLRRRPDIRYAERQLAMATADVGVAVAEMFPKFTLTGSYGFENLHLGKTKGQGESWGYGGSLITPLFHGGSLKANVKRYEWIYQQAFFDYEKSVLAALKESESSIARFAKARASFLEREKAAQSNLEELSQTNQLFEKGIANRLELLDAQYSAIRSLRKEVDAKAEMQLQLVALYKALGGAWPDEEYCHSERE